MWSSGSSCKVIQVVGGCPFLSAVGLRSAFSCWLLAGDHFQVLEAALGSWSYGPLRDMAVHSFKASGVISLLRALLNR